MSMMSQESAGTLGWSAERIWGLVILFVATLAAGAFFIDGLYALLTAWAAPEYSHGPLIPVLSALLFLRQLKEYPPQPGPKPDRWPGVALIFLALLFGLVGKLSGIDDLVAYATIIWVGGILLVSFGWNTGKHFWPPVVHLVYMLPLPGVIYYKLTNGLQLVSSELGVWLLQLVNVPVYLEGNIIDLGVMRLHVAEACSGLRYLFPILSFSYIFAVLYRGPLWHKAVLLLAAAPITVLMNSVRIAIAGVIADIYGVEWLDGFTHFFEGWVIFLACIVLLFLLARVMMFFLPEKKTLAEALDLETDGLGTQAARLRFVQASPAMISAAVVMLSLALIWPYVTPQRGAIEIDRQSFATFPRELGNWRQQGAATRLDEGIAEVLGADDYRSVYFTSPTAAAPVEFFSAWYNDQTKGGVHSPEICLPGGGWEIAWLERTDIGQSLDLETPFEINRAIIQKGQARMMVYYWFDQKGRKIAWDFAAKYWLMVDGIRTGRTDGALVRLHLSDGRGHRDDTRRCGLKNHNTGDAHDAGSCAHCHGRADAGVVVDVDPAEPGRRIKLTATNGVHPIRLHRHAAEAQFGFERLRRLQDRPIARQQDAAVGRPRAGDRAQDELRIGNRLGMRVPLQRGRERFDPKRRRLVPSAPRDGEDFGQGRRRRAVDRRQLRAATPNGAIFIWQADIEALHLPIGEVDHARLISAEQRAVAAASQIAVEIQRMDGDGHIVRGRGQRHMDPVDPDAKGRADGFARVLRIQPAAAAIGHDLRRRRRSRKQRRNAKRPRNGGRCIVL